MKKSPLIVLTFVALAAILAGCERDDVETIPYSPDFVEMVEADRVDHATIAREPSGMVYITGWTKPDASPGEKFRVEVLDSDDSVFRFLRDRRVSFDVLPVQQELDQRHFMLMLPGLVFVALCITVVVFVLMLAFRLVKAIERIADNMER